MTKKLSGLQRQVLALYRAILREVSSKRKRAEGGMDHSQLRAFARQEFERYRGVERKNYQLIEHLIRKGQKQLGMLREADVRGVKLTGSASYGDSKAAGERR